MQDVTSKNRRFNWDQICKWTVNQVKLRCPIAVWLPNYKWREDLGHDLLTGVTLMFINVPQGFAFSVLAEVDLMFGLYTSFFSGFLYTIFGTATFSSFGPTAIGSVFTGEAVVRISTQDYTTNDVAVVVTFLIGVYYLAGFILRLGVLAAVFRKPFTTGFLTACAMQILAKTLKMVLGMKAPVNSGKFAFFYNCYAIVDRFHLINYPTAIISLTTITILCLNALVLRPYVAKYTPFALPVEAIIMIISIVVSYCFNFESMGVPVVGNVPTGFPIPTLPNMSLVPEVWLLSLMVAVINFTTTVSMTLLFNKEIDDDQELLAMGIINLICCNLQCLTVGNSMLRTVIVVNLGVRTLLASVISSTLLLSVILFAGPLFHHLPYCILGSIIIIAAGQLLIERLLEVKSIWKSSLENGFIWGVTFSVGVIIELQVGMFAGVLLTFRQIISEVSLRQKLKSDDVEIIEAEHSPSVPDSTKGTPRPKLWK